METGMNREGLLALTRYNAYANRLVLQAASHLPEADLDRQASPSHGSARGLLKHMLECETWFLAFCQGQPCAVDVDSLATLPQLSTAWEELAFRQETFVIQLQPADLEREVLVHLRNTEYHFPVWKLLTQALIHSTHHRGELSIVLTGLGCPLPTLDILLHFMQESGQIWEAAV